MAVEVTRTEPASVAEVPVAVVRRPDWLGRIIGLSVFLVGVGLLLAVFYWSTRLTAPTAAAGQKLDVNWAAGFGVHVLKLFLSGFIASWIAGRGAQLYAAANRALSGD